MTIEEARKWAIQEVCGGGKPFVQCTTCGRYDCENDLIVSLAAKAYLSGYEAGK